jgi:signal transduction histidine kinase/CheY-like chemotaxis protein
VSDSLQTKGRSVKILIVDDEEIVLSLARDALEDSGYKVTLACGGNEALEKIKKEYFDFILTDIRMPGLDGLELARQARKIRPAIGIIFMTGYANLTTAKDAIKEGAYDYIMKPFELNELRQAVKNAIKKKSKDVEDTLTNELNRLSDLNQLMYTVSDRRSLMRLSLGFAMMQGQASFGCIAYKDSEENKVGIVRTDGQSAVNFQESTEKFEYDVFEFNSPEFDAPFVIRSIEEHPLYIKRENPALASSLIPPWHNQAYHLVNIALKRGTKLYGFLILGYEKDSGNPIGSEMKLLVITSSQIAISLENIILLEESRTAYSRLKDLQDQTIELEKMATKGQMSAEIGHELNNFLGVVTGNLSLMEYHLGKKDYDGLDRYLTSIKTNLENIRKFTEGLVDLVPMKSEFYACDINKLVSDVIEYLKVQNRFLNIEVQFKQSENQIFVQADAGQLQQLLYNLLNNAADATQERDDSIEKKIIITTETSEKNSYSIIVSDNGVGIEPQLVNKMFKEQFTTKKTGHGFGMLVTSRIIESHHGQPIVVSTLGRGTTIRVEFPLETLKLEPEPVS